MHLNLEQYSASRSGSGIDLVIAGAGTGKTKTLIEKIKNTVKYGKINPDKILVLTFSRKAADEIGVRLFHDPEFSHINTGVREIMTGTFHSIAYKILKENQDIFLKTFKRKTFPKIMDASEKEKACYETIKESLDSLCGIPIKAAANLMDSLNENNRFYRKLVKIGIINEFKKIRKKFDEYKIDENYIDFNDMIEMATFLLNSNPSLRKSIQDSFHYIFIDEFQDTSDDNYRFFRCLLSDESPNLFIVGDDWQSIYGFRKARVDYIVNLDKYFHGIKTHRLNINYRSRPEIVNISNKFIRLNRFRTCKNLRSWKAKGGIIKGHSSTDEKHEAEILYGIIMEEKKSGGTIAVLYRDNYIGESIVNIFKNSKALHLLDNLILMTIHSSKGLEFDTVIIIGISDGTLPSSSSNIEEERRILYVGLTRAKEHLHVIYRKDKKGAARFSEELKFEKCSFKKKTKRKIEDFLLLLKTQNIFF